MDGVIRSGLALLQESEPNVRYADRLTEARDAAQQEGAGFWTACGGDFRVLPEPLHGTVTIRPLAGDCSEFATYVEAQMYYAQFPDAQPAIDANRDGRACEEVFGATKAIAVPGNP